jgi:hypothetical protein
MTARATALAATVLIGVALVATGCTAQRDYDPNGRCLGWQLVVAAETPAGSTDASPMVDLTFTNTSQAACVFGGVPGVRLIRSTKDASAGIIQKEPTLEQAVEVAPNEKAYARVSFSTPSSCSSVAVTTLRVVAPHVAGGTYSVRAPATLFGCAGTDTVGTVGQVTAKRGP